MIRGFEPLGPGESGPRAGVLHTDRCDIDTPTRVLNSSESRYKTKGITWKPYLNEIVEYVRNFDERRLAAIRKRNGAMNGELQDVRDVIRKNPGRLSLFYPRFPEGTIITEEDIRTLLDLQGLSGVDLVSIPDSPGLAPAAYSARIQSARDYIDQRFPRRECFPIVELREEHDAFVKKAEVALDAGFHAIGFRFGSFTDYYANYRALSGLSRSETWFHLHGVPRFWRGDYTTAQIHVAPFAGVDTVSLDAPRGGPRPPGTAEGVRRFDGRSLGHLPKAMHQEFYGQDLGCSCPLCDGKSLDDFYREYLIGPKSRRPSVPRLRQHTFVHEVFASYSEFRSWRDAYLSGRNREYVATKRFLVGRLAALGMLP